MTRLRGTLRRLYSQGASDEWVKKPSMAIGGTGDHPYSKEAKEYGKGGLSDDIGNVAH